MFCLQGVRKSVLGRPLCLPCILPSQAGRKAVYGQQVATLLWVGFSACHFSALPSRNAYIMCAGDLNTALGGFSASHASCSAKEGSVLCRGLRAYCCKCRYCAHTTPCAGLRSIIMQRSGTAE